MNRRAAAAAVTLALVGVCLSSNAELEHIRPCPTEDSVGCYWDAQVQGNGLGRSFTVTEDGAVTYWDGRP